MSLPRHQQYKDSEVAWLGKVPEHWQVHRLKNLFEIRKRIVGEEGHQVLSITQRGIKVKDIESNDGQLSMDYSKYQIVHPGDFAMNHMDLLTGFVDISPYAGVTSPDYRVFALRDGVLCEPRYFLYLLQNAYRQKIFYAFGQGASEFGRWRFPTDQFNDFRFPCPPPGEQTAIATFLDRETGKIDALITEQEKLLALLAEKRQATISHAVTKGLNPDAPMKDSGVAWLGEAPEHWEIKSIRHILEGIGDVDHFMPASVDKGVPYLMTGDLKEFVSDVSLDDCKQVCHNDYLELSKRIKSSKGDVIMARYATIGTLMYVDVDIDFLVSYSCVTLKTNHSKISGLYLFQYMKSDAFRQGVENQINTNTQGNVGIKDLQSVKIAVPPIDEQTVIAAFLDAETTKLDALKTESERAIALLKERRSALIAAAVTGQIDVRALVTEPEAA